MDDQAKTLGLVAVVGAALGAGVALGLGARVLAVAAAAGVAAGAAAGVASARRRSPAAPGMLPTQANPALH
jgi:hypothetical protein